MYVLLLYKHTSHTRGNSRGLSTTQLSGTLYVVVTSTALRVGNSNNSSFPYILIFFFLAVWGVATGRVTPRHVGSSQTRDQICVSHIDRWTFWHWITREVLSYTSYSEQSQSPEARTEIPLVPQWMWSCGNQRESKLFLERTPITGNSGVWARSSWAQGHTPHGVSRVVLFILFT